MQVVRASAIPTPDKQPPNVKVVNPSRHAPGAFTPIDGVIAVEALSDDNVRVASVDFYAGSIHLGTDDAAPWSTTFDTSVWPNGQTSFIKAVAKDGAGNTSDDQVYVIVVRGSTTTPRQPSPPVRTARTTTATARSTTPPTPAARARPTPTRPTRQRRQPAPTARTTTATARPTTRPTPAAPASRTPTRPTRSFRSPPARTARTTTATARPTHPADPGCSSSTDTDEANAAPAACEDGKDNDGDGKIDYPADPGCSIPTDVDESNPVLVCSDGKDNDGDGKIDYPADPGCTGPADGDESNAVGAGPKLQWSPPSLSNPVTINVPETGGIGGLDPSRDYVLKLGHRKTGLGVTGGRNVVIMGGRITCQDIVDSNLSRGRGIEVWDNKGTVHIEGVLFENCGTGIAVSAPEAVLQVQNCRFEDIDSPWQLDASGRDPDLARPQGDPHRPADRGLLVEGTSLDERQRDAATEDRPAEHQLPPVHPGRIDSGRASYLHLAHELRHPLHLQQLLERDGLVAELLPPEAAGRMGHVRQSRRDEPVPPLPHHRLRRSDASTSRRRAEHEALTDDNRGRRQGDAIERLNTPSLAGERWHWGRPGAGDFVPAGVAGSAYLSPGYA